MAWDTSRNYYQRADERWLAIERDLQPILDRVKVPDTRWCNLVDYVWELEKAARLSGSKEVLELLKEWERKTWP